VNSRRGATVGAGQRGDGVALRCDAHGRVLEVLHARDELAAAFPLERPFPLLLASSCQAKGLAFLEQLQQEGAAFDWELALTGEVAPFRFTGVRNDDQTLLIAGASGGDDAYTLLSEMMQINNEQLTALRSLHRHHPPPTRSPESDPPPTRPPESPQVQPVPPSEGDEALFDDLTRLTNELMAVQRQLAKSNAELEHLSAQKSHFGGLVAHDLRNPLGAIRSYSDFLLEDLRGELADDHVEFLTTINETAAVALKVVHGLLDLTAIETGQLCLEREPTDLAALLRRSVFIARTLASKRGLEVELSLPDALAPLELDGAKVGQVVDNLLGNAIKLAPEGSRVSVTLEARDAEVELRVADQGPGIPAEHLEHIFVPYARSAGRAGRRSLGLGLSIVRNIVEGHGGTVEVESELGVGSIFRVLLPR
jgi:two-component system OmpR family sensor kinase